MAVLDGLKELLPYVEHYKIQYDAASHGVKIHYGESREYWKTTKDLIGRTKGNRVPETSKSAHDDHRPPDTAKALVRSTPATPAKGARTGVITPLSFEGGYKWDRNSCWLDASLTAIFPAASQDYANIIEPFFGIVPNQHPLQDLRQHIHTRLNTDLRDFKEGGYTILVLQRNALREKLVGLEGYPVTSISAFQSDWIRFITRPPDRRQPPPVNLERAICYFGSCSVVFKSCDGTDHDHFQLERIKWRKPFVVSPELCRWYRGSLRDWFFDLMKPDKAERMSACWQALDGNRFCSGEAIQYEVFLNIPNALVIEFDGVEDGDPWDIPKTLYPCRGDSAASGRGVKYSVVSHVYFQRSRSHYMTRYLSSEKRVFDHDGEKHDGHAVRRDGALKGLLHGVSNRLRDLPAGFVLRAVVYHLEGGEEAGKYFRNSQMERAEKKLFLRFKTRSSSHTGIPTSCDLNRSDVEVVPNVSRNSSFGENVYQKTYWALGFL
ncbi:hypothetical protein R3P38DRAFT_2590093 [Favolaschia claudopus]|uniref:Uncharacterized protein n=1 Tax=Favolaschia claudopus TaxID=2862362 RepID=A0AAV9Z0V0_9AGAR